MAPDPLPASLEAGSTVRVLAPGELLFRQGDRAAAIYKVESGRLRLIRSGGTLFFYASEEPGKDFTLLHQSEFGTGDLKNVRILGSTGGPGAAVKGGGRARRTGAGHTSLKRQ